MGCSNCGHSLGNDDKFCKNCGSPQQEETPRSSSEFSKNSDLNALWESDEESSEFSAVRTESFGKNEHEGFGHWFSAFLLVILISLFLLNAWSSALVILILLVFCSPLTKEYVFDRMGFEVGIGSQSVSLIVGVLAIATLLYYEMPLSQQKEKLNQPQVLLGSNERLSFLVELEQLIAQNQLEEVVAKIEAYKKAHPSPDPLIDTITSDTLTADKESTRTARIARLQLIVPELIAHRRYKEAWQLAKQTDDETLNDLAVSAGEKFIPMEEARLLESLTSLKAGDYKSRAAVYLALLELLPEDEVYKAKYSTYKRSDLAQLEYDKAVEYAKAGNLALSDEHLMIVLKKYRGSHLEKNAEKLLAKNKDAAKLRPKRRAAAKTEKAPSNAISGLKLVKWTWAAEYNYAVVKGTVKNVTSRSIRYIAAVATFYDRRGNFVASDKGPLELDPLPPGKSCGFRVFVRHKPTMTKGKVHFIHQKLKSGDPFS